MGSFMFSSQRHRREMERGRWITYITCPFCGEHGKERHTLIARAKTLCVCLLLEQLLKLWSYKGMATEASMAWRRPVVETPCASKSKML